MARKMCNFGNIGRVRRWETRIFVVVFICIACHSVTNSEIVPWSIAATGHRAETGGNGRDTPPRNNREPTTTSSMQCHSCANKQTNAECNALEVDYCGGDQESCQTELRYSNYRLSITKQCKQKLACEYATHNNSVDCEGINVSPVCFYCCQGSRCNMDLPINPLNQLVDPRALYILTYEVLYNTSQPTPVMSVCGEFYAHRFLEKFVSAQQKLNVNCLIINVKVDVKARVRLYGNKTPGYNSRCLWVRKGYKRFSHWKNCSSYRNILEPPIVEVNTYINLSNTDAYTPERHFNDCANLLRNVLKGYDAFESQICTDMTRRNDCFSVIPATNSGLQCSQAQMSPRQFTEKRSQWKCPKNLIFDGASKKCRSQVTKTTTTTPPMTAETTTSSTPQSTTTNVEIVSPLNMTSSASDMSVVTPERATVSDKPVTVAVYLTTPTEMETSPMATTEYMVTQTPMTSWGIEILNQSRQLLLLEGGDTKNVYFRLWANKTELCGGSEETCSLSLQFSVLPGDSAKTPRCRSTDAEIPQVVIGRPSWVTSTSHDYCSMSVSGDTTDDVNVLPLKAVLDWKYDDSQTQYLQVTLNVSRDGEVGIEDGTINVLPIKVVDRDRKSTCQSINDPHVTTFDGLEYNNFYEGEFVLYRHADLPFSVHAIYQQCGHLVSASCNCAVAVQSGDDVVVIDRCMRKRKPFRRLDGSVDKNPVTVMSVDLYLNGQLTPGTRIYEDSDGKKYFIYLPHGAYVKVMVSGLLVNVWIVPSPSDIGHTKGLCGTYDWNKTNEFNLRNGSVLEQPDKEEGKRPQPHEFILDWQVDLYGDDTIFRGVKKGGELFILQRYCTCVSGQPGICSYSHDISTCDIYQGQDVTDQFIVNAINLTTSSNTRKKRAINENSVLKTNEPIVINKGFIPKDTHPWKYGWNETYAKKFCSDYIRDKYPLGQLCSQIPGVNFDQEIITCVEDIHIIGDDSWADSAREAMKEQCLDEIQKNGNLPRNITQQIEGSMCTNDCSGHGNCVNGKCHCEIGYTSADCSAKVKQPPYKVELNKYGLCDRRYMSCDAVIVYGMNFVRSPTLKCSLQKCQVLDTSQAPILLGKPTLLIAQFINFNAVECPIPSHNQSYIINVTNNGKIYSEGLLFIPFDSRCNDCSTNTTTCVKKRNSCIIDGECYEDKGLKGNNNDSCEVCKPYNNEYSWTTLEVPRCRPPWWQSVPDWVVALVAAVGGSLVGLLVGFLLYRCCCKSRRKPDPAQEVALDNQTDIVASSPFEDHMLHRNRGLPAYSGGGDQFADLTLRQPDYEETYFYNDGRGVENGIDSNTYFY